MVCAEGMVLHRGVRVRVRVRGRGRGSSRGSGSGKGRVDARMTIGV